jgi:hypothetical protein
MKIRPVEVDVLHADEQTDGRTDWGTDRYDEANSHISQFCEGA